MVLKHVCSIAGVLECCSGERLEKSISKGSLVEGMKERLKITAIELELSSSLCTAVSSLLRLVPPSTGFTVRSGTRIPSSFQKLMRMGRAGGDC